MNTKKPIFAILLTSIFTFMLFNNTHAQDDYKQVDETKGLQVGETAANFEAKTVDGKTFSLKKALKKGPVVVVFYRGQWCPICNRHLGQMQDSLQQIYDKGATVIAVSPEKQENLKKTKEKTGAEFTLVYDENYKIGEAFDVIFLPKKTTRTAYNTMLNAKLEEAHSDNSQRLPVPATFVLDQEGKVVWRHFDHNYKKRSTIKDILEHIPIKK